MNMLRNCCAFNKTEGILCSTGDVTDGKDTALTASFTSCSSTTNADTTSPGIESSTNNDRLDLKSMHFVPIKYMVEHYAKDVENYTLVGGVFDPESKMVHKIYNPSPPTNLPGMEGRPFFQPTLR